jgi:Uma2 family endonuclease
MGAKTGLSVDEYLHTTFPDLDREYRDGELVERSLPDYLHGKTQLLLAGFCAALRKRLSIFPCTETRMRIRSRRMYTYEAGLLEMRSLKISELGVELAGTHIFE